ncbi:MAG: hypothetical protein WD875_04220 [Pirellulales bacterium]
MSRIQSTQDDESIGSDSFLDVVSNIVGILIILVMVAGSRAKTYVAQPHETPENRAVESKSVDTKTELRAARHTAQSLSGELGKLTHEASRLSNEVKAAEYARIELGTFVATAEHELAKQREKLDEKARKEQDLAEKLVAARRKLDEVRRKQISVVSIAAPEIEVKSYPSPISSTVFMTEEHYRLLGKRLARVPFEELKEMLLDERRQLVWKLEDLPEVSGSVGPRDGFRLDYHFVRTARGGSLTAAFYIPVQSNLGEPLAEALADGSDFRRHLAKLDRQNTTITVWTYPDSFDEFRQLRKELYEMGFSVAGRPLDKDSRIGFSPGGSKSAAQ